MGKYNRGASTNFYYILCDCLAGFTAFILASIATGLYLQAIWSWYIGVVVSFMMIYILCGKDTRIYNITTFFYPDRFFKKVTFSFCTAALITTFLLLLNGGKIKNDSFYGMFLGFCYIALLFSSFFTHYVLRKYFADNHRTAIVGYIPRYEKFVRFLNQSNIDADIVGYIAIDELDTQGYLGHIKDFEKIVHENGIDQVYIMIQQYGKELEIQPFINRCVEMGVTIRVVVNSYQSCGAQSYVSSVGTYPIITYHTVMLNKTSRAVKRAMDICGGAAGILLFSPIMLLTALAIKLDSKGPVVFKQKRIGLNGRCFYMYKFRSMCIDAEKKKKELLHKNEMGGIMFKMKDDPRITKVGKFIRKTSIDELPQFFNVLRGDMSLVGTRPPTVDEVKLYKPNHWRRMSIKPGITGMWQVSGRNAVTDFDKIVELDTAYIDKWDLFVDFKIIFLTVWQVFHNKNAF